MSSEWMQTTWGDVATLEYGKGIRDYQNANGDFIVYGTNGVIGKHTKALCEFPSVIIGRKGAYRGIHYSSQPFFVIDTAFYLNPKIQFDTKWAYYCLLTYDINGMDSGSAIPSTSREEFYKLPLLLPPLTEQFKIMSILGTLDDRITLLRETNATLEAIAQALFKSWFVDFDPVHAKAQGRQPEGMDEQTAALFPDRFVESELGMVPLGWEIKRLDSFLELAYGKALKANDRVNGDIPVYGSGGITGYHNESLVSSTSIIVGRKGTIGSLYWEESPFFPIDTVFYVRSNFPMTYCFYLLKTLGLNEMNTDAAVPGLNRNNVYRLLVSLPNLPVISSFSKITSVIRDKIFCNNNQIKTLADLRDTLLPRLISGQLRLPDVEEMVG